MVSVLDLIIPSLLRERYLFTCSPMTIIMWPFWFVAVLDVIYCHGAATRRVDVSTIAYLLFLWTQVLCHYWDNTSKSRASDVMTTQSLGGEVACRFIANSHADWHADISICVVATSVPSERVFFSERRHHHHFRLSIKLASAAWFTHRHTWEYKN